MATKVLIGIQARSGSSRLPKKGLELISGLSILERIVTASTAAARFLDRQDMQCRVVVLIPHGDELARHFPRYEFFEGAEDDVLSRYAAASAKYAPDYIARLTGDCPLLPSYVVTQIVKMAVVNGYDYCSNVDERFRTSYDGSDCEVMSRRLLEETDGTATAAPDREHVTTSIRRAPPDWAKIGFVCNYLDFSQMKLSVDTPEDLERVRNVFESAQDKYHRACLAFGKQAVHRQ